METTTRETAFQIKKKEKKIATETERQMNLGDTKKRKQAKKVPSSFFGLFLVSLFRFTQVPLSSVRNYKTNETGESACSNHQADIATITPNEIPITFSLSKTS